MEMQDIGNDNGIFHTNIGVGRMRYCIIMYLALDMNVLQISIKQAERLMLCPRGKQMRNVDSIF